jgi:hypothetical protein
VACSAGRNHLSTRAEGPSPLALEAFRQLQLYSTCGEAILKAQTILSSVEFCFVCELRTKKKMRIFIMLPMHFSRGSSVDAAIFGDGNERCRLLVFIPSCESLIHAAANLQG